MNERHAEEQRWIRGIMWAVLVWGSLLALGTLLFGIDQQRGGIRFAPNPVRGGIMLAFVLGFLGCWQWVLRRRRVRTAAAHTTAPDGDPDAGNDSTGG